ncbi:MAG: DNA polymerase III subunit gamma/tau [Myxococcaceae bacterium]|nr:DNA polymerase III subunit gamma/tau [Myxococcaceae bacterium]
MAGTPAGATPLSRVTAPAPEVRLVNVRRPPEPEAAAPVDERLFAEEGSAEGCAAGECLPDTQPEPEAAPSPVGNGRDNPALPAGERWRAAVESVRSTSPRHGTALAHGRLLWLRAGEVGLAYAPTAAFHRGMVTGTTGRPQVEKMLAEHFGRPMKLAVEEATGEGASSTLSIAEQESQARAAHAQNTEGKVRTHPAIRAVLKFLGGEIEHIQVLEPERPPASPTVESPEESA